MNCSISNSERNSWNSNTTSSWLHPECIILTMLLFSSPNVSYLLLFLLPFHQIVLFLKMHLSLLFLKRKGTISDEGQYWF